MIKECMLNGLLACSWHFQQSAEVAVADGRWQAGNAGTEVEKVVDVQGLDLALQTAGLDRT